MTWCPPNLYNRVTDVEILNIPRGISDKAAAEWRAA